MDDEQWQRLKRQAFSELQTIVENRELNSRNVMLWQSVPYTRTREQEY